MSKKLTTEEFIVKANKIHRNRYDYSKVNYVNNKIKVEIICTAHGSFLQKPNDHLSNHGCSVCKGVNKSNTTDFIKKSKLIHNNTYDYSKIVYKNAFTPVTIICKKHGEFLQRPNYHLCGWGCIKCGYEKNLTHFSSVPEKEFLDYLHIKNRTKCICGFYVDGYDDETNTIYEFLGDYWHGNPNKFNQTDLNKSKNKTFGELYTYTFNRFRILKSKGYIIKYIWESDWNSFKNKITKKLEIVTYE